MIYIRVKLRVWKDGSSYGQDLDEQLGNLFS